MPHKTDIKSLNYNELVQYVESINEKKFRAAQLYSWMHEKLAESYDEMTNISDKLKDTLKEDTLYTSLKIVKMQESRIDGTRKYLFELYDGNLIESVFMKYHHGNSVCISSQVGCKMGCRFCASTLNGCVRNLSPSEMLDQIYRIGWDQVPVVEYLEEKLGIPVKMENDADAGALAEWKFGAGKGCQNMIFLTFGTGLGSGLILNGQLYRGSTGMAGEAGHIRMENEGPKGYGKVGSLEGFCSGGGISRLAGYFGTEGSAKELAERAEAGDERALAVYARCGAVFGRGLAILIDLLNPEKIVAGSVYARSHHLLDKTMYEELEKEALPMNRAACEIVPAALGERIGDYAAVVAAVNSLSIL